MRLRHAVLPIALLLAPAALADEVWDTPAGDVIYEADEGDTAILSYDVGGGERGYLYFPGLAGNSTERGIHEGYWIVPGESATDCGATLAGPNGIESTHWGRTTIVFHEKAFPTGWTLLTGACFGEPDSPLVGTPVTGD